MINLGVLVALPNTVSRNCVVKFSWSENESVTVKVTLIFLNLSKKGGPIPTAIS